jgi:folate-binding protein YgfZ
MNTEWAAFLSSTNAIVADGIVLHFGDSLSELQAAARDPVKADLSHFGVICIRGDDAAGFLQGQLSCDVNTLAINASTYGSYCTAKGRALATFLLWRGDTAFYMALPRDMLPAIQKRLTMYVLRSKVKLSNVSNELVLIGITDPRPLTGLSRTFAALPLVDHSGVRCDDAILIRLSATRWMWSGSPGDAAQTWPRLGNEFRSVGTPAWAWLDIRAGIPWIFPATQEQFVPQMINLELIGGVSFQKGCYPGQEIVARTQYLGKLKRRMYLARIPVGPVPTPGTELYSDDLGDQASGMVVDAQASPNGGFDMLAVAQSASIETSVVHLGSADGPALNPLPLPYML